MLSYAEAETVLAHVFRADETAQQGPLRGRLAQLRRLGIPLGLNPGKGRKIEYGMEQLYQLAFCLEFEELNVDPRNIAGLVRVFWGNMLYRSVFKIAERDLDYPSGDHVPDDVIFWFSAEFMSSRWAPRGGSLQEQGAEFSPVLEIGHGRITEEVLTSAMYRGEGRAYVLNISNVVRKVHEAFAFVAGALPDESNRKNPPGGRPTHVSS